jgi:membrane protease YdiL (CAAX protease family)
VANTPRDRANTSVGGPPPGFSGAFLPSAAPHTIDASAAVFTFVGAWVVAQIVTSLILLALHGDADTDPSFGVLAVALLGAWSSYLVAMWIASRRAGTRDPIADYGIEIRWPDLLGLGVGAVAQLVLIRAVYLPLEALWPATFSEDRLTENAQDIVDRAGSGSVWLVVVIVVIGAPLVEELFYRGLLQRSLAARFSQGPVLVGVAALFALVHFRPIEFPGLFAVGLLFGWAALRWDRLGPAIMIHVGFNLTGLLLVL